jgi:hypothetical protein
MRNAECGMSKSQITTAAIGMSSQANVEATLQQTLL